MIEPRIIAMSLGLLSIACAAPLMAQDETEVADASLIRFELRGGVGSAGNGNEEHCRSGPALTVGAGVGSRGPLILKATADLLLGPFGACDDAGRLTTFQGDLVEVRGLTEFVFAPRIAAQIGYALDMGAVTVSASGGGGFIRTVTNFGPHGGEPGQPRWPLKPAKWIPWYGVIMGVGRDVDGFALELELGRHSVRNRYYSLDGGVLVSDFQLPRRMVRLGLVVPL